MEIINITEMLNASLQVESSWVGFTQPSNKPNLLVFFQTTLYRFEFGLIPLLAIKDSY